MSCCVMVASRPPYSLGQLKPTHPPSCNLRCHFNRRCQSPAPSCNTPSLSSTEPLLPRASGRLAASQLLSSWRKASSSVLKSRSIGLNASLDSGSLESCCALTSYCSRQDSRAGEFRLALLDESERSFPRVIESVEVSPHFHFLLVIVARVLMAELLHQPLGFEHMLTRQRKEIVHPALCRRLQFRIGHNLGHQTPVLELFGREAVADGKAERDGPRQAFRVA